jgi:hypothetical protein
MDWILHLTGFSPFFFQKSHYDLSYMSVLKEFFDCNYYYRN